MADIGRRRAVWYALAGAALSAGAPGGLLILRETITPRPLAAELLGDWITYVYVFLSTAVVLTALGYALGRQADRLLSLAVTDPLTGLLNRRAFRRRLAEELTRSARYASPVSLLMIDVDGLKRINDEQGHAAGDRVIRGVADAIRGALRESDFGARWGGDEFAIIAPTTPPAAALRSAERLVEHVSRLALSKTDGTVTVSVGIASYDPARDDRTDVTRMVRTADGALYLAKAGGRNRIRAASSLGQSAQTSSSG